MKKVGMATCFLDNYGACLQAFALQRRIEEMGYDSEILQYVEPKGYDINGTLFHRMIVNSFTRRLRSILSTEYKRIYLFKKECSHFKKAYLKMSKKRMYNFNDVSKNAQNYDMFVCGSDQIWNPNFYGELNRVYYLDFAGEKKRVAYAPSIGVSDIDEEYRKEFYRLLNQFSYISCRENTGCELVKKYANRESKVVLDPTLLFNAQEWRKYAYSEMKYKESFPPKNQKYIFCYLFGSRPFYYEFINKIQQITGLEVYIIPFNKLHMQQKYHVIYSAGPLDFVRFISEADLVITDSFHATAFSINLNVPFYSLLRNSQNEKNNMNSRVVDILKLTNLTSRLWIDETDYSYFTKDVDWDQSNKIIQNKRIEDREWLKNALSH